MGFIVIMVCVFAFFWFLDSQNNDSSNNTSEYVWNNALDLSVDYTEDKDGYYLTISSKKQPPKNAIAMVRFLYSDYSSMRARQDSSIPPFFKDSEGDFYASAPFGEVIFVPFGAIKYATNGNYNSIITVLTFRENNDFIEHGKQLFNIDLPSPRNWYLSEYFRPIIGLMMTIARVDGSLSRESVKAVRESLESVATEVPKEEYPTFKQIIKSEPSDTILNLGLKTKERYPQANMSEIMDIIIDFSNKASLLDFQHRELLEEIAEVLGVTTEKISNLDNSIKFHYDMLGVSEDASVDDIRRAYRLKMKDFHPDKYVNSPKEFQELAHKKTIEIRESYDYLLKILSKKKH